MDKSSTSEHIFWLRTWRDRSISFWPKVGRFKCIINRERISIIPIENDPDKVLDLDISEIQNCRLFYVSGNANRSVEVILNHRKVMLSPVNPFEVMSILFSNHSEASAMVNIINAFRSNIDPKINTSSYLRQLVANKEHKRFKGINENWDRHAKELDQHTPPWDYYALYADKLLYAKMIAISFVLIIAVIALMLSIAYVLDNLNII